MTGIGEEIEGAALLVAPQIGVPLKIAKAAAIGLAMLVVAGLGAWVIWKLFFAERAAKAVTATVQHQADTTMSAAGTKSGQDAIKIIVDNGKASAGTDRAIQEALREISKAKGADQQVSDDIDGLVRRTICVRVSAAGLPECQQMRRTAP